MQKYLILNADDFGASSRVNAAIRLVHQEGLLTSASLMVAEAGCAEAVAMAREMPALGVGLHLVVTTDLAALPPAEIPRLVGKEGRFRSDLLRVGLNYTFARQAQMQLRREMEAQFERFARTGLSWSHIDGHQHFHTPPVVWDVLVELALRYGVHRFRLPRESIRAHRRRQGDGPNLNTIASVIFRLLRRRNLRVLRTRFAEAGKSFFVCDRVYGLLQTGNLHADYLMRLLDHLEGTTNEIYLHPGAERARLLTAEQRTAREQDVEAHALLHPALRERLQRGDLRTGSYAEVESALLAQLHTAKQESPASATK
jgi:hopanoid biosynthesis associated protein HpnK